MPDPTSQSNYTQIATSHLSLEWNVNYSRRFIAGSATHTLIARQDGVNEVVFDTAHLDIESVQVEGEHAKYALKGEHEVMGSALHIDLPKTLVSGSSISIHISYKTTKDCTALQWLEKEQTQGQIFPFLFSQCQPIYARSLAPVQDTPSVKLTYSAKVTSVLPVLLSAKRVSPPSDGPAHGGKVIGVDEVTYVYDQPVPIPSYLIAIAAGNVRYRPFPVVDGKDWTSGVWAEPELMTAAYWEFSEDTTKFLAAEEKIVGSYRFGVYDLLVLPPSFPYGGMENPCLSFVAPTLLAGDRSLVDVVIHELTHSYFGNGITHVDATHFWLNEGWTTYMERLLQRLLHSEAHRGLSCIIGARSLDEALEQFIDIPRYQRLIIDFAYGENPDFAYSRVPYEKGSNLILHIERVIGGLDVFLPYVRDYVDTFMGQSITTEQWKSHLYTYYRNHGGDEKIQALDSIDWNAWFYGEGLALPVKMEYDMTLAKEANQLAERWDASRAISDITKLEFQSSDIDVMDAKQKVVFLERLQTFSCLPSAHLFHLDELYKLSSTLSAELRLRFYQLVLPDSTSAAAKHFAPQAALWVVGNDGTGVIKGRMKFCRPVFRAIYKVDAQLAISTFKKSEEMFHPIAKKLIEKDLDLA
ncbi:hypothetical protein SERLA73DRAFT_188178 [Serpula lacrymans var. lacrymans S7.3]|uniref:Peptidase M1 leukotriene A4 hydrolase/aminopeptidase C-terminal domain-containing protein n=2 Tax=Serpula lacrymans var. lacrymans TaxID=341189 RepID=F8QAV6_SERL3|nr:uncharacterized protein SERLADRAFT_363710 [Serpula lacrymans var. lacrymans S7.9]EGN94342.1 hypothetical protein SERLA73DRAFT_188178 [Serpula lacrymans var. lacrymans S7.3]EGO19829.1 hypothetical protein SERLADRAFT_363710 [Serpula lacrymans var. lacrymans S7.9]